MEQRKFFVKYVLPQRRQVGILGLLLVISITLQLVSPQFLRSFIDAATSSQPLSNLLIIAFLFILATFFSQITAIFLTVFTENISWKATNALRADLIRHCLNLDLGFHNSHLPGEFIERIDGDITLLNNFFSQFIIQIVTNILLLAGIAILLFIEDWRAGIGMLVFTLIALLILLKLQGISLPYRKATRAAYANFFGFTEERLNGTEDIKANGAVPYVKARFTILIQKMLQTDRTSQLVGGISRAAAISLFMFGTALGLAIGFYLFSNNIITLGGVYLIYAYTSQLRLPVDQIILQLDDYQRSRAGFERVRELFETENKLVDGPGLDFETGEVSFEFDRVSFSYLPNRPVLHELSFKIEKGTVLGLLGRTGSGKTTISRLLARFYDPSDGQILFNKQDLRQARLEQLRNNIGVVTQEVQLFHATLRDNISFFDQNIKDEKILAALEGLGLGVWYSLLPRGLDTIISSNSGVSAGEAQLIAFARVFLKNPRLLILDEASSRLDPSTEQLLEQAITKLLKGRTALIIAHRLSTLDRADQIMILDQGEIIEYGPREMLLEDSTSRFFSLSHLGMEDSQT